MKKAKKLLALMLAVAMMAGMVPTQAANVSAAGTDQNTGLLSLIHI